MKSLASFLPASKNQCFGIIMYKDLVGDLLAAATTLQPALDEHVYAFFF